MDLEQLEQSFLRLIADLSNILLFQTEVMAVDIMALVDIRLVETGIDERGNPFVDYTVSYKKRKVKLGRYTGHVDFQLNNQMLASTSSGLTNIIPLERSANGVRVRVVIGPRDQETRNKIEGNDKHRTGFLNPAEQEVRKVEKIREPVIAKLIQEEYFT